MISPYANAEALGHYRAALALGHPEQAELHEAIAALASPELAPEVEHRIGSLHLRRGAWELAEAALARPPTAAWPRTAVGSRRTRRRSPPTR